MMMLQMQLGLVTTLAASSIRFWLSFSLESLCSTLSRLIRICLWIVSSPLLMLMALQFIRCIPSRILSILSSIKLSIFFRAYKISLSSKVSSCSFSSSLSIWGFSLLKSSRDQNRLLLRSRLVYSTCLLSFLTNLKQFFYKVYRIKVLYSSSFSSGLISGFFSSISTWQYLSPFLPLEPSSCRGTFSRFTFSLSLSSSPVICLRLVSITIFESLMENSNLALSTWFDYSSIRLLECSSSWALCTNSSLSLQNQSSLMVPLDISSNSWKGIQCSFLFIERNSLNCTRVSSLSFRRRLRIQKMLIIQYLNPEGILIGQIESIRQSETAFSTNIKESGIESGLWAGLVLNRNIQYWLTDSFQFMEYFVEEEEYLQPPPGAEHQAGYSQRTTVNPISIKQFLDPSINTVRITSVLLLIGVILLLFSFHSSSQFQSTPPVALPKILWLYTKNEPEGEQMFEQTMINYYISFYQRAGYEVRFANSWTAYDWLGEEIAQNITRTMQKVQIDVSVDQMLMLALLIEQGGILIKNFDTLLLEDLEFIEDGFSGVASDNWSCLPHQARIFLSLEEFKQASFPRYSDSFIAATPKSVLLLQTLQLYMQIMTTTPTPSFQYIRLLEWKDNTEVHTARNLLQDCLSIVVQKNREIAQQHIPRRKEESVCERVGLQLFQDNNPIIDAVSVPEAGLIQYLTTVNRTNCKKHEKMLINIGKNGIRELLGDILRKQKEVSIIQKGSILHNIIEVKGNREFFMETLPPRDITLCIVTLDPLEEGDIRASFAKLQKQTYQSWTAIFFTQDQSSNLKAEQWEGRLKVLSSSGNKGKNIEIAVAKHCEHRAFALLLNKGEKFSNQTALEELADIVRPRQVLGAFIPLRYNDTLMIPRSAMGRFYRKEDAILQPKLDLLKNISNHLRLFSVQVYKFLPQFDLRDSYGRYYQDRIIFLMSFLDMIRQEITKTEQLYVIRRYADRFNVPRKVVLSEGVVLETDRIDGIDMDQMKRTFTRIETQSMHINIESLIYFKIPFQKMIVFNEGDEFVPFDKKGGEPLIPKIIHQAWLGGELPPVKAYFFKKAGVVYPSYELKLWKLQNITKDNFPLTFEILKNIELFNSRSPYNKFATMTDILRHEALYRFGGFWKDAAMNFLRPVFDHFRKYKLALATDKALRHRWLQGMCFFANIKEYPALGRINNFKHLNRMRIYESDPMDIAGPVDFRQLIIGREEYDPETLILSYQTFYPAQLGQHPAGDLCSIPEKEGAVQDFQVVEKEYGVLKNCSEIYPYAFGIEHNRFGVSWLFRKR